MSDGGEQKYIEGVADFGYEDDPRGTFEDFVFKTKSKVTSMNFYGGDTLTYSQNPDFYEFRVLKRNRNWTSKENGNLVKQPSWVFDKFGPFIQKQKD